MNVAEPDDHYVYVYIDPRNFEEFYYGKGRGQRKYTHLDDAKDTAKVRRIEAIKAAGDKPIIRVVAAGLTEQEALLVEATLIWKAGRTLTNISSGHFADKFRPHDSFHKELPGFDFANHVYHVNVSSGPHRDWADCMRFGFLSAGQGRKWSRSIQSLHVGDVVLAYEPRAGYVGVGVVREPAVRVADFRIDGQPVSSLRLKQSGILENAEDAAKSEYLCRVAWTAAVESSQAKRKSGIAIPRGVRASLDPQHKLVRFIEASFDVSVPKLLGGQPIATRLPDHRGPSDGAGSR